MEQTNTYPPFTEFFKMVKPKFIHIAESFAESLGREPQWEDMTNPNIQIWRMKLLERISPNTAKMYIAVLLSVLNQVKDDIDIQFTNYKSVRVKKEASTFVYLTDKDLEAFSAVRTKNDRERFAKALFLTQAFTGARYSDAINFDLNNVTDGQLVYVTEKTGVSCSVPLKPILNELIPQIKLAKMSKIAYSKQIKRLSFKAGIRDDVKIYQSGKAFIKKKYECITSHTARRSFATNLYLLGADLLTISKFMGHSTTEMTTRYIWGYKPMDAKLNKFFE